MVVCCKNIPNKDPALKEAVDLISRRTLVPFFYHAKPSSRPAADPVSLRNYVRTVRASFNSNSDNGAARRLELSKFFRVPRQWVTGEALVRFEVVKKCSAGD